MVRTSGLAVSGMFVTLLYASAASAAEPAPGAEGAFPARAFHPAMGPDNWLTVEGARIQSRFQPSLSFWFGYERDPLVLETAVCREALLDGQCPPGALVVRDEVGLVENQFVGELTGTLSFFGRLQLGLGLPIVALTGHQVDPRTGDTDELRALGLGDPRVEAKYRVLGRARGLGLAGALTMTVPVADLAGQTEDAHIGHDVPIITPKIIVDYRRKALDVGANVGLGLRPQTARLGSAEVGSSLLWGVAAGYRLGTRWRPVLEITGSATPLVGPEDAPTEVAVAFQALLRSVTLTMGGGTSLVRGVGGPAGRLFVGAAWAPTTGDRDHDGVPDSADACPDVAEDEDEFLARDGCPEDDNDSDGVLDEADRCPHEPEDIDEHQDDDGCPDPDNDGDGIIDGYDSCVSVPEDKDGDRDDDGCPDDDSDADGVPDSEDRCVNDPEDTDGSADDDGCPDPDNDEDGVPDEADECADEAEDRDRFQDGDGCPEQGGRPLRRRGR